MCLFSQSACNVHSAVPRGSVGASSQPFGVRMSVRPSLTSWPLPTASPVAARAGRRVRSRHPHRAPPPWLQLIPGQRGFLITSLRQHFAGLAVVVDVHEKRELESGSRSRWGSRSMRRACGRDLFHHDNVLPEPADRDDNRVAVAVHVDRQIAEGVDVTVVKFSSRKRCFAPRRRVVPEFARDDVAGGRRDSCA